MMKSAKGIRRVNAAICDYKTGDFTVLLVEAEMSFLETIKELFMKKANCYSLKVG